MRIDGLGGRPEQPGETCGQPPDAAMATGADTVTLRWEPICRDGCLPVPRFLSREAAVGWAVRHRQALGHELDIACALDVASDGEVEV